MQALQKRIPIDEVLVPLTVVNGADSVPSVEEKVEGGERGKAGSSLYRVLVVEDDPALMAMYSYVLGEANLQVDQSLDGHDALEKLSAAPYDLVITDLNLPGMDGISLLHWIQHHRPATPTVVVSGDGSADRILAALRGGAKDFLVKPFTLLEFQEMIERWSKPQPSFNREVFSSLMKQMMHDVRGETVSLEAMLKLLERGKFGEMDSGVKEALLTMQGVLGQLKGLTEDYCLLARNLLQGGGEVPTERIELKEEIISPVLGEMGGDLQRKEISVSCSQDPAVEDEAYVMGNRVMLKSVFRTLFSNAIRHCRPAGALSYGISNNGRRYRIQVANEGEVVPAHLQESIFDEFVQVRPADASPCQGGGLGLGLALAKDILRQHGGDIWYESFAKGSKFICTLPLIPAVAEG